MVHFSSFDILYAFSNIVTISQNLLYGIGIISKVLYLIKPEKKKPMFLFKACFAEIKG